MNAITGFPLVTGPVGHDGPVNAVAPPWDLATAYAGAMAILAAERHRRLTGQGQRIVLPLQDMALAATSALGYLGEAVVNNVDRPRFGNEIFGTFGRDFRTKDGRYVMICIFSDRHVDALAAAGGFKDAFAVIEKKRGVDLKTDAGRWDARNELCAVIEPWVAAHTAAEVGAALKKAGALWAPYQTFRELAQTRTPWPDNPMFTVLDQPGIGRYPVAASPLQFGAVAARIAPARAGARPAYRRDPFRLSSAFRRTRSAGCMTRRWWVARRAERRPERSRGALPFAGKVSPLVASLLGRDDGT